MKRKYLLFFGMTLFISNSLIAANIAVPLKTTLTGKITDHSTGESLPGVNIYLPDLKTGAVSDANGNYKIENLPASKVFVQVTFIGYKLITVIIDLSVIATMDFALEESAKELNEIVITGLSKSAEKNKTPTPISIISKTELLENSSANIIDALSKQPGISQVSTGSGISKPVIRGLGYNRVVVVNDGIRQEGQQWGDEHGIEMDEYAVNRIEILKGPASIAFGSDAMAGVINFIPAATLPEGKIRGNVLANYQSNNGLYGYSLNIAANHKGLFMDLRFSDKNAHAYRNKYDGYVFNSGFSERTYGGIIGMNKSWGYSHLHFSVYNMTPGIVEGDRDSLTGNFLKPARQNDTTEVMEIASANDLKSYAEFTPYQKIHHYKAVLNNSFIMGNGSLKAIIGWQQNRRQEYSDVLNPDEYGLYLFLNTINYDVRYLFPEKNNWELSTGINGMQQLNQNKGIEFIIPDYNLFDIGSFFYAKKNIGKLSVSGGIRYDNRSINAEELFLDASGNPVHSTEPGAEKLFNHFKRDFSDISGSMGGTYSITENVIAKLNFSRGFRAPNLSELSANGVHEGTFQYIRGDASLKPETSFQTDAVLIANSHHISFELSLFSSSIDNFIFLHKLNGFADADSVIVIDEGEFPVFSYSQGAANLNGGEIMIDIHPHPLDWLHFENAFSYVQSVQRDQPDSTKYLPFTPATKITSDLQASFRKIGKYLANPYVKLEAENYLKQDKFFSAYNTETATPGYTLLNAGCGTDFTFKNKTLFSFYFNVNNITDKAYQSHLSRLKYTAENFANGRKGIYNMGRNFSFKLLIPIDFR